MRDRELDADRLTASYEALRQAFPKMYFYDHGPDDGFGVTNFQIQSDRFVPAAHLALFSPLQALLETP